MYHFRMLLQGTRACRLVAMPRSPCSSQRLIGLRYLPQIFQWNIRCAFPGLGVTLTLPTCASQWNHLRCHHTTIRPRILKHRWKHRAVQVLDWPISVCRKRKRCRFGCSNTEARTSTSHGEHQTTRLESMPTYRPHGQCGPPFCAYQRHNGNGFAPASVGHDFFQEVHEACDSTHLWLLGFAHPKGEDIEGYKISQRCFRP